jgi:FkbM family methyltransferase
MKRAEDRMAEDNYWSEAQGFLGQHLKPSETLMAPIRLKKKFEHLYPYSHSHGAEVSSFDWLLIHKGMVDKFHRPFLLKAIATFKPVFANEVFVILAKQDLGTTAHPAHLKSFLDQVNPAPVGDRSWLKGIKNLLFQGNLTAQQFDLVLRRLASLDTQVKQLEQAQGRSRIADTKAIAAMSNTDFVNRCRAACQTAYLGDSTILCRVLSRYLMYVDSQDMSLAPHLCLNGYWEPSVTYAFARSIQPGWNCIDVGANHGYFSVLMASLVGKTGKVLALEPNTNLVQLIQRTLIVNGLTDTIAVSSLAASDTNGQPVTLAVPRGQIGGASIARQAGTGDDAIATETVTIDRLTESWSHVDFIKIDTEGAEEAVWRGMRQTLQRNPHIIIVLEFGATRYPDGNAFLQEILREGFILRAIDGTVAHRPLTVEQCMTERGEQHWDLYLSRR